MPSRFRVRQLACTLLVLGAGVLSAQDRAPHQVIDTARGGVVTFDAMIADLLTADVVVVGEQHDSANTHRLERSLLDGIARGPRKAVVSLEMFERDVQEPLEHFAMGHIEEEAFLADGRPWPRYRTDYKPLVDLAIGKDWPIVAANVPRAIASDVSKGGLDALRSKTDAEKKLFARELQCPTDDAYFNRFVGEMGGHGGTAGATGTGATGTTGTAERYYMAQCLKDETMAESVAEAAVAGAARGAPPLVVHFTGAFHADFGQGTVERIRRRLPGRRVVIVTMVPVEKLDVPLPDAAERRRADYLVYTIAGKE